MISCFPYPENNVVAHIINLSAEHTAANRVPAAAAAAEERLNNYTLPSSSPARYPLSSTTRAAAKIIKSIPSRARVSILKAESV